MTSLRLYRLSVGFLVCWGLSGCGGEDVLQEQVSLDSSSLASRFGGKGVKKTDSTAKSSKKRKASKAKAKAAGGGKSAGGSGGTPDMSKMMSGQGGGGQGQGGGSNAGNASSATPDMSKMMSGQGSQGQGGGGNGGKASGAMPDMSMMMKGQGGGQGGSGGGSKGTPDMSMMMKGQGGQGGGSEEKGSGDFGSLLRGSQGGGDKDGDDDDENKSTPELAVNRFLDALERGEFEELKQVISNRATAASLRRLRAGTTSERELERLQKKYATGVYVMGVKTSPGRNELRVAIGKPATESTAGVQVADIVVRRGVAEVWRVFAIRRASS